MKRDKSINLNIWGGGKYRKPLLIRGARQVGKTWLTREFGKEFDSYVEINFERDPDFAEIFNRNLSPDRIISELSAAVGKVIKPGKTLLFLDEIQESVQAIKSLRYFYEELPGLHVISAGSLIGFTLEKTPTGVGRLNYLNLYPLSFAEFLSATGNSILRENIQNQPINKPLLDIHHNKLLRLVKDYMLIGGMPAVVKSYIETLDFLTCRNIQSDIIQSFMDDFVKYAKDAELPYLHMLFEAIPHQVGSKFKYSSVSQDIRSYHFVNGLDLLETAGIIHKVYQSRADGIPLNSRITSSKFKVIIFDTGLYQNMLNMDLNHWIMENDFMRVNQGAAAEQFAGQELASHYNSTKFSNLTYWHREKRNSSAEVDYLIEKEGQVIPIEVKSNVKGGMKSMHLFLMEKKGQYGIKISRAPFSTCSTHNSLPLYAMEKLKP